MLGGPDRYFDPSSLELPPAGFYGDVGRNTVIGPDLSTLDFSLSKTFSFWEERSLVFRAEFFNVLSHANFGIPRNRIFNSRDRIPGSVGRISNTVTSARQIQFGLKFIF